jgi:PAS domain-containing protein
VGRGRHAVALGDLAEECDRARADAEEQRRRLEELFRQAPAAIAVLHGPEHVYTFVNPSYLQVVGPHEPAELLGKPMHEAVPEFEGKAYPELFDHIHANDDSWIDEVPVTLDRAATAPSTRRTSMRWSSPTGAPTAGSRAFSPRPWRSPSRSVPAPRSRTVRARDELLALVSHDLKNPLSVAKGQAQLLRRRLVRSGIAESPAIDA